MADDLSIQDRNQKVMSILKKNWLTIATVISVTTAIIVGIILRASTEKWTERQLLYLEFPGTMFLRGLTALIIPIIVSSMISSIGRLDVSLSGRIGMRAIIYYFCTTFSAVILGVILVSLIHPGTVGSNVKPSVNVRPVTTVDTILDLIRNLIPPNLVQATFAQYRTVLTPDPNNLNETDIYKWKVTGEYANGFNILGLITFSIIFGIMIGKNPEASKPFLDVVVSINELVMKVTGLIINLTPFGILFLIMPRIISVDSVNDFLGGVGWYTVTVLLGLLIHGFFLLPLIYFIITKKNPYLFIVKMSEALLTAFGTSSSSATLPVTMRCLQNNVKIDPRIVNVLIPVGATINMDGTALYEAVAAIYIAQNYRESLAFVEIIIISLTATAASVGAAGIPQVTIRTKSTINLLNIYWNLFLTQAGLVTMVLVLNAVGLPADAVSMIFVVDWLLDRFRTTVNVLGDSFGAAAVAHLSEDELNKSIVNDELTHRPSIDNPEYIVTKH
ncbi:Sodium:dicarboxylate symporter-like protein 1 [Leptotrombidium deliense]|uniref:Amino acid transporter n=1 Tax=Leptotrombidium deliense TaxID=299467 RepID=A0A443SP77_9ACAR|nr:Sodium:dicarboxylate symporter-like protein 1 [Leptotrombidium deliense]